MISRRGVVVDISRRTALGCGLAVPPLAKHLICNGAHHFALLHARFALVMNG